MRLVESHPSGLDFHTFFTYTFSTFLLGAEWWFSCGTWHQQAQHPRRNGGCWSTTSVDAGPSRSRSQRGNVDRKMNHYPKHPYAHRKIMKFSQTYSMFLMEIGWSNMIQLELIMETTNKLITTGGFLVTICIVAMIWRYPGPGSRGDDSTDATTWWSRFSETLEVSTCWSTMWATKKTSMYCLCKGVILHHFREREMLGRERSRK